MKKLLFSLSLAAAFAGLAVTPAYAQSSGAVTPKGSKSDQSIIKIRQLDMIIQILPLNIRKEQYDPLFRSLERSRAKEKQIRALEDDDLEKIDPKLSDAVKNALDKGSYPPHDLLVDAMKLMKAFGIRRQIATEEMVDDLYKTLKTTFDAGQMKVMANSLDAVQLDPSIKKDSLTDEAKQRFFIKRIFLDETTYDLLLKLQKTAS